MKTAFFLSGMLVAGSLLFHSPQKSAATFAAYKTTKARKTFSMPVAPVRMVIDKSDYELKVYDAKGWYATYPVVFGNSTLADKRMEGDKNTPEGQYKIVNKRYHQKWDRYMGLDYPTQQDLQKFNQRKQRGEIPQWAKPGGGVGIHGTWPNEDFVIDRYKNWTDGCISLKREDVEELYTYIPIGTPVTIQK
jgi:murein L,D-transpeptidase YafK